MSMNTASMNNDRSKFRFLDLPAELRNRIYHDALVESAPIKLDGLCFLIKEPAITRANRQLRSESLPILYGSNTVEFDFPGYVNDFLDSLDVTKRGLLKRIEVGRAICDGRTSCNWFWAVRMTLKTTHRDYSGKGLGDGVMKIPLVLGEKRGEGDIVWVDEQSVEQYELQNVIDEFDAIVVRK